jgi:hypothetical protein
VTAPVYYIVFHQERWRIEYAGLYLGEFGTAEAAADAALQVARSRIGAKSPQIFTDGDGRMTVREPE